MSRKRRGGGAGGQLRGCSHTFASGSEPPGCFVFCLSILWPPTAISCPVWVACEALQWSRDTQSCPFTFGSYGLWARPGKYKSVRK